MANQWGRGNNPYRFKPVEFDLTLSFKKKRKKTFTLSKHCFVFFQWVNTSGFWSLGWDFLFVLHIWSSVMRRQMFLTSCIMPMNSEKAQLSWFKTLLRKLAAMSLSWLRSSAMCLCSRSDGQGSVSNQRKTCLFNRVCQSYFGKSYVSQQ